MKGRLITQYRELTPIEIYDKQKKVGKKEEEILCRNRAREAMTLEDYFAEMEREKAAALGGWNESSKEWFMRKWGRV